jgi:hypothetical protein
MRRSTPFLILPFLIAFVAAADAGVVLPRLGAVIEIDRIKPPDPYGDRSLRIQWVLSRLQCEGQRVWLLDPEAPANGCDILYLDGPVSAKALQDLKDSRTGILQSENRSVLRNLSTERTVQLSPNSLLKFQRSGRRRVLTVSPDMADCFRDYEAVRTLARALSWLAGIPDGTPGVLPFPNGKCSAVVYIIHGEGNPRNIGTFGREFAEGPGALTYAVSEKSIGQYPEILKRFAQNPGHEIAVHNHESYSSEEQALEANILLHRKELMGHPPVGVIGPYLIYQDDLREALARHQFRWFLDKDLPYPLNIPLPPDGEPIIDITESLKPYDGWWDKEAAADLWKTGLAFKRTHREIAVASWHDVHMAAEPSPYLEFMRYVKGFPDVWQTTAREIQAFYKNRWRTRVEVLSNTDAYVTVRVNDAPAGLTLFRSRKGQPEIAVWDGPKSGVERLEWKPEAEILEQGEKSTSVMVKWGAVGKAMPRNQLDTEFAIINAGRQSIIRDTITIHLPEELRARMKKMLPLELRTSLYGVKGLKFKDLRVISLNTGSAPPGEIPVPVDRLPAQSVQFYRLRFPIPEKPAGTARLYDRFKKHPYTAAGGMIAVLSLFTFTIRGLKRKFRPSLH